MADVCIVTKTWRYGVAWQVHCLTQAIADAGRSVCLIAPRSEPAGREAQSPRLTRIMVARELVGSAGPVARKLATLRRILGSLAATAAERRRTATFLITIPDPLAFSLLTFLFLRLTRARILFLVHDAVPHAWMFGPRLRWLERWAHAASYRLATELIVFTPALRRALQEQFGISPGKITVIPSGPLGLERMPPPPGDGLLFVFGTLRRNKSVLEIIEGVRLARAVDPGVRLLVAGEPHPSEPEYWQQCQAAMAADPAGFDVRAGFVADEDLPGLVARVDAFVLAYRNFDSLSAVGVLAAFSGRPVLCTAAGGLADLMAEGLAHQKLAEPVTAASVAEAILAFRARSQAEWDVWVAASTAHFEKTLSWRSVGQRFIERFR